MQGFLADPGTGGRGEAVDELLDDVLDRLGLGDPDLQATARQTHTIHTEINMWVGLRSIFSVGKLDSVVLVYGGSWLLVFFAQSEPLSFSRSVGAMPDPR